MTDLSFARRAPLAATTSPSENEGVFSDILYALTKPEEILVKAVGSLVSDNPRFVQSSTGIADQANFSDLVRETGIGGRGDAAGNIFAAVLGIGAAVANPLDPLNVASLAKTTQAGKALKFLEGVKTVNRLERVSLFNSRLIDASKALNALDRTKALTNIGGVKQIAKKSALRGIAKRFLERGIDKNTVRKELAIQSDRIDNVNDLLRTLKPDQLEQGKTLLERINRGQQTLFGFNVSRNPILRNIVRNPNAATLGDRVFSSKALDRLGARALAPVFFATDKVVKPLLGNTKEFAIRFLNSFDANLPISEVATETRSILTKLGRQVSNAREAVGDDIKRQVAGLISHFKGTPEEAVAKYTELLNYIELPEDALVSKRVLQQTLESNSADIARLVSEDYDAPVDLFTRSVERTNLTPTQSSFLKPTKLPKADTKTLVQDVNEPHRFSASKIGNAELRYDSSKVVFTLPTDTAKGFEPAIKLTNSFKVPGIGKYTVVEDGSKAHLVTRNLIENQVKDVNARHIHTLEQMASMLSKRKIALTDISLDSLRFGSDGSVQLLDPRVLSKVKTGVAALNINQEAVLRLASDAGLNNIKLRSLVRGKFRKVTNKSFRFVDLSTDKRFLDPTLGGSVRPTKYFDEVAGYDSKVDIEALSAEDKLNFDRAVDSILTERKVAPIVYAIDDLGMFHIYSGKMDLLAAQRLGVEHIPTIEVGYLGLVSKGAVEGGAGTVARSVSETLAETLEDIPSPYTLLDAKDSLPDNIRIISDSKIITNKAGDFDSVTSFNIRGRLSRLLSRAESDSVVARSLSPRHHQDFADVLNRFAPTANDELELIKIVANSTDITALEKSLADAGIPIKASRLGGDDIQRLVSDFDSLKAEANTVISDLTSKGVFIVDDPRLIDSYTIGKNGANTVIQINQDSLVVSNRGLTREKLAEQVKDLIEQSAGGLDKGALVEIRASDGVSRLTGREILGDSRSSILEQSRASGGVFFASPDQVERLESIGVFRDDRLVGKLGKHSSLKTAIRSKAKTKVGIVTVSGDLLVSINHSNIEQFMRDVFGEANRAHQEVVVITPKAIHVSNLAGQHSIGRLTTKNLRPLQRRMKRVARSLKDAGIGDDIPVVFHTPLGAFWKDIYGVAKTESGRPLGDILSNGFHLKVEDRLKNIDLSLFDTSSIVAHTDRHLKAPEGVVRDMVKFAVDNFDEAYLRRVENSIPTTFREGYYARILTPTIQRQINDLWERFLQSNPDLRDRWSTSFRQRQLTDLTTTEIQDLWTKFRTNPQDFITFGKNIDHPFMRAWATLDLDTQEMFVLNPVLSAEAARVRAEKAILKKEAREELIQKAALTPQDGLSRDEVVRFLNSNTEFVQLDQLEKTAVETLGRLGSNLDQATVEADRVAIDAERKAVINDLKNIAAKKRSLQKIRSKLKIQTVGDENALREVAISADDARKLVSEGVIDFKNVRDSFAGPIVHIPFDVVRDSDAAKGMKFHIFPAAVRKDIDNYYRMINQEARGFLRLWDNFNDVFRGVTLFAFPAIVPYTNRNIFSNFLLGAVGGVRVASYKLAAPFFNRVRTSFRSAESVENTLADLKKMFIQTPNGPVFGDEIWENFVKSGGLTGGLHFNEFGLNSSTIRKFVELGAEPSSSLVRSNFVLSSKFIQKPASFAQSIENYFRLTAFVDTLSKGGTFEQAALNVKKIFYNYNELTFFEQRGLRRLIPFYSWLRFNTPRMIQTMATNPLFHLRLRQAINRIEQGAGGPASDAELEDWLTAVTPLTVGRRDGKAQIIGLASLIPMADAYKALSPKGFFSMIGGGLSPVVKIPAEVTFNKSGFTFNSITKIPDAGPVRTLFTPEPARSGTLAKLGINRTFEHIINGTLRPVSMTVKALDSLLDNQNIRGEDPDLFRTLLGMTLFRLYDSDTTRARNEITFRKNRLKSAAKFFMRYGRKNNRPDFTDAGKKLLLGVNVESY